MTPLHSHAERLAKAINRPGDEWVIERIEEAMRDVVREAALIGDEHECWRTETYKDNPGYQIREHFDINPPHEEARD